MKEKERNVALIDKAYKLTRSEYLENKTELSDEDIVRILDLPAEKEIRTQIKSYTDKDYLELAKDNTKLSQLTESLKNDAEYLTYRGSYIAKSKLLYESPVTLCNEIPSLLIGEEIGESFYLLPYGYAKDKSENFKKFADMLERDNFIDIKRNYSTKLKHNFKKGHNQGNNIFFFITSDKTDYEKIRQEINKCVYNRKEVQNKTAKYIVYIEQSNRCGSFSFDTTGKLVTEKEYTLKQIRSFDNERPLVARGRMQSIPSGTLKNLSDNKESVNTFFNSLLLRGEVEMIRRHKELQKYDLKYLNCLEALKQITNHTQSELLQNSNRLFIQSEIESEFYKDLIKEKKRNVAHEEAPTQGDKSMPGEQKELSFSEQVDLVLAGKYNRFDALKVCDTPDLLLQSGLKQLPMLYTPRHLREAIQQKDLHNHTHGIRIEQIKSLPELIKNPVMIYDSLSRSDSLLVLTSEIDVDKMPIVVSIRPNGKGTYELKKVDSNFITSMYGRENFEQHINSVINNGKIIYWNKEKSQALFSVLGQRLPKGLNNLDPYKILHQTNSVVNTQFQTRTTEQEKRNVTLEEAPTQGDKSMPGEQKELYISEEEAVRIQLAREIRQNMPNLSDGERAAALAILEAGAASMKMTLRDYVQTTFSHGVFGDFDKAQNAAQQQGVEINGAVSVSGFGANARAVIYASKTADFSTWCHELSHIWQVQLTGELKVNAEKVFQVQNGNWQESTYTFADGHTDTSAEAFAYGFEDFLKHKAGEMAAEDKKAIFEKFADYMSRTYNGVKENIKVNEDIAKVYEQFVQLDDNILAEAEKAVRMEKDLYDSKKNINALLNSPDLRSSKKVSKTLGYVSPQFSRLAKQYGYDIEGFRHTIDNFFINHANNRHSTARTETARGNVAITNDDILNIAKVYESPDYIIFGTKTKTGNPAIVYAKNMGNATVFVEDVRSGKKELAAETLYKKSGAIDVSSKKEVPELYAHSDPESISIVDVKKEFVNHIANGELIFQAAYHGSGASFDHFDTEHYGLSGEGSMSFGWGTYLTESEAIARDYADRQNGIGKKLDSLLKKYPDLYSHITPIYNHMSLGDSFEEAKKNYVGYLRENHIPGIRKITKSIEELKAEDFAELFKKDRNLYTVSIPDGKYLSWNNDVPEATKTEIAEKLHSHLVESDPESYSGNAANYLRQELESLFESEMDGQRFYGSLADYLGSERQASEFLKESGYTGISYPAGTIYGNGNGATNYVIFNDDDIEIKEHLQFQTRTTEQKERKKIEIQTYKFQNGETIDEILSKQTSWATDAECLDNMIDNSLREVADFADEKENELLKKISIAKNNPEVDLKLLAVQTDAAARYMSAKHYDYRLADVGNRPFSKDFINPYAQDDFPYELPSWIKNHLEEYPNQNEPEHTSEEEKAYQEWEEMLEDNQREENIISHNVLKTKDSEKNISNTQREENSYLNSEELKSSLKKALNEIAKPLEVIPFTRENYNLLFPHSHIISPIENVKLGEHQFEKLDIKERQHILKAVHDTVATPDIIINEKRKTVFDDEKEAHVYAKAFKIDGKNKAVQSVVVSIEDENVSISTHLREINNVVNKIKMPEQLIFASTEIGQMVERLTGKQLGTVNPTRENEIFAPPVTTIPQNTENSINYHGLTLTKKDIVMQHKSLEKEDLLNVINFSNWTYFNSEKISTKVYDVEISASLYEQLLPSEYKKRTIKEDEVVCIQYRKSVLSEEQDQFLIEKFNKNNFMLLQQKEIQIDVELKNKIKSICNSYIEPQNNNSYTAEILDKIRAAGIEVVTDKDEFDRILKQEERLQKMAGKSPKWLTVDDVKLLSGWGYKEFDDIVQIQKAILLSNYELNDKKISVNKAIELLGREEFLGSISRSAFHWTSSNSKNGSHVHFDSSILFSRDKEYYQNRERLEQAHKESREHIGILNELLTKESYFTFNSEDSRKFVEQVKQWEKDNSNPRKLIVVGNIPPVMKVLGIADRLIEVEHSTLDKMIRDYPLYPDDKQGHKLNIELIHQIPSQLANPVMVFKSKTREDSYVFFTERKDSEGRSILIPLAADKHKGRIVINEITSMYGRNNEIDFVKSNFDEDKLLYIDKERAEQWKNEWALKTKSSGGELESKVQFLGQRITDIETYNPNILTKERLVNFISGNDKSEYLQKMTAGENTYGFVHNGKIYLNPEIMNSNAAVHEYTHLWDAYTQKTNPELWNKGLEIFKDSKYWNEVINDPNYQDIKNDENLVLSEIHSRICGNIAEKVLERIAELDGEQVKLDTIDWDEETWKYITEEMGFQQFNNVFHRYPYINPELEIRTSNLKDFLSTPMKDLMSEKKISVNIALDNEKSTIKNNNEKSKERHSDAKDYLIQTTRLFLSKLKEKNLPFLKGKEQGSIIIIKPQVVRDAATGKAFTGYTQLMAQALIQTLYDQKKLPELEYDLITYDQAKACGTFIKKGSPHITLTNYNRTTNSASKQMYYFKSGCNSPEMIDLHKESIARNRAIKRIRLSLEEKEIPSERQTEENNKITLLHYEEMTYLKALNKDTEQYFDSLLAEEKNMLTELCKKTPLTQKNVKELAETLRKDRLISTQLSLQKNSERYFDATECIVPEDFIAKAMAAASLGCSLETTEKTIDSITKDLHQTLSKNIDHYDYGKAFEVGEVITEKCIKNCKEMKNQEYEAAELAKKLEQKQQELKKNPINLLMELLNKNDLSNRTIGGYER